MKKLIFILIAIVAVSCGTYKTDAVTISPVEETLDLQGSKADLYSKANAWMTSKFADDDSTIQVQNADDGQLTGRYKLKTLSNPYNSLNVYTLVAVRVNTNSAIITLTPQPYGSITGQTEGTYEGMSYPEAQAKQDLQALITDFENAMK